MRLPPILVGGRSGLPSPHPGQAGQEPPSSRPGWGEALKIATGSRSLSRTLLAAMVVGTTLMIVNLGGQLADGFLTASLAFKVFLTYAVPWGNATLGIAIGVRDRSA